MKDLTEKPFLSEDTQSSKPPVWKKPLHKAKVPSSHQFLNKMKVLRENDTSNLPTSEYKKEEKSVLTSPKSNYLQKLRECLLDPILRSHFRDFLKDSFSNENIEFWLAVEEYKVTPQAHMPKKARDIYQRYFKVGSKKELNLSASARETIARNISNQIGPTSQVEKMGRIFDKAQEEIFTTMANSAFQQFSLTKFYKDYIVLKQKLNAVQEKFEQENKKLIKLKKEYSSTKLKLDGLTFERNNYLQLISDLTKGEKINTKSVLHVTIIELMGEILNIGD
eukprot:TRINITY_DN8965_c0_g1_i3.p1 TRINITY_DN8965_c0_g1~~TRINITY_DN8965_c0_g1_i3.p1  ORF type:complete len:279 (-),score=47.40 TRINITY_DN8965_c0_g1_i3:779-1615(-)